MSTHSVLLFVLESCAQWEDGLSVASLAKAVCEFVFEKCRWRAKSSRNRFYRRHGLLRRRLKSSIVLEGEKGAETAGERF